MSSKKKGTHTFFGPNIVPKKVWVPKKKELILLGTFLPVLFFLFKKYRQNPFFQVLFFLNQFKQKKKYRQKSTQKYEFLFFWNPYFFWKPYFFSAQCSARKKYEFLFFWNSYFFWNPYFFWHYVGPEKSMSSFFFGTHTFFGTMFGPNKYDVSLGTHSFFWNPYFLSGTMLGLKKYEFLFFWNPYFFWHYVGPEKVWVWVSIFL